MITKRDTKIVSYARSMLRGVVHCSYCKRLGDEDLDPDQNAWHIDHVVPLARGGPDALFNMVMACRKCNLAKHTRQWDPASGTRAGNGFMWSAEDYEHYVPREFFFCGDADTQLGLVSQFCLVAQRWVDEEGWAESDALTAVHSMVVLQLNKHSLSCNGVEVAT